MLGGLGHYPFVQVSKKSKRNPYLINLLEGYCVGDGNSDDAAGYVRAVADALDGGVIFAPPPPGGFYRMESGTVTLPADKQLTIFSYGSKLKSFHANPVFSINNNGSLYSTFDEPHHSLIGMRLYANTYGSGSGVKCQDANSQALRWLKLVGFNKGVEFRNERFWAEQNEVDSVHVFHCNYAFYHATGYTFDGSSAGVVSLVNDSIVIAAHPWSTGDAVSYSAGGGTAIVGLTNNQNCWIIKVDANTVKLAASKIDALANTPINLTGLGVGVSHKVGVASQATTNYTRATVGGVAQSYNSTHAAAAYGLYSETLVSLYRSRFNLNIFPDASLAEGAYIDGHMAGMKGNIDIENTDAAAANVRGIHFGLNANACNVDMESDIRGNITAANRWVIDGSLVMQGWVDDNLGQGPAQVRKQGVAGYLGEGICDRDGTLRFQPRMTAADELQLRLGDAYNKRSKVLDDTTGGMASLQHEEATTGEVTIAASATPSVQGYSAALLNYAGPQNITNFTGSFEGKKLRLRWNNVNATIVHNNAAGGIVLSGSANYTPGAGAAIMQLEYVVDRWRQVVPIVQP